MSVSSGYVFGMHVGLSPSPHHSAQILETCVFRVHGPRGGDVSRRWSAMFKNTRDEGLNLSSEDVSGQVDGSNGLDKGEKIQITDEDVDPEILYWSLAIIFYALGARIPYFVMNGFIRRVWGRFGIDKVNLLSNGVYLVRFRGKENMEKVLSGGPVMFDNRPVIMKRWEPGINLEKEGIKEVPIWVRLPGLNLKFWGQTSLMKIGKLIGRPVKTDKITANKEKLEYARLMVEVPVDGEFSAEIDFLDEKGVTVNQKVSYEWKPINCNKCKGMGHDEGNCPNLWTRKQNRRRETMNRETVRKVWKPVQVRQ
ncbi:uncharacterized protein LOC110706131 [Chenopodium quinoa]|uniref:uncharacterized protein LOC110706131 n=1 Tax=Chenopodium quinoa TaxID=63459 RepID=UPI000B78612B|nr:uncharacterized protein LOC110706131 [Chenopodium quinoa]